MTVREWARELPLWPDGLHWFDVATLMEKKGSKALLFTGPPEAAARLVESGFPVVARTTENGQGHAVTIHGVERVQITSECGPVARVLVMNPTEGKSTWLSARAFEARQSGQRLMLLYPPSAQETLETSRFPLKIAQQVNARVRAQTLLERAKKHGQPNRQKLDLL